MNIMRHIFKAMVGFATYYLCDFSQILNFNKARFLPFKIIIIIPFDRGMIKIKTACAKCLAQRLTFNKVQLFS